MTLQIFLFVQWYFLLQNYVRVVEVWWDEYKDYFYASRPESKALAYGDISELKKFREDHNCRSFKWFMEEIAYDITSHYPLPPKNVDWGEVSIRDIQISKCVCLETEFGGRQREMKVNEREFLGGSLGKNCLVTSPSLPPGSYNYPDTRPCVLSSQPLHVGLSAQEGTLSTLSSSCHFSFLLSDSLSWLIPAYPNALNVEITRPEKPFLFFPIPSKSLSPVIFPWVFITQS